MIDPKSITTGGVRTAEILRDTGADGFTVATVRQPTGHLYHGLRWNGEPGDHKGYPTARGYPAWFYLPEEIADVLATHYADHTLD